MKINPINNVNFQRLLIHPQMAENLKSHTMEQIQQLKDFGDRVEDIKLFDIVLDKDSRVRIKKSDDNSPQYIDYFSNFRAEESKLGKHYSYTCYDGGGETEVGGFYPDLPRVFTAEFGKEAKAKYAEYKKLGLYEQAEFLARLFETREIRHIEAEKARETEKLKKELEERTEKEKISDAVDNLMKKYEMKIEESETEEPFRVIKLERKSFFKRIFHK